MTHKKDLVSFYVKATPKASKDVIAGWTDGSPAELSVSVCAPPTDGKANKAVCKLVASSMGIPKTSIRVERGQTSRHKKLVVDISQADFDVWKAGIANAGDE